MSEFMTLTWESVRSYYADRFTKQGPDGTLPLDAMLDLVSSIEHSRYACGLYPWTSMHDLCIAQTPVVYPYQGPLLKISPTPDGNLDFRYVDASSEQQQWHRVVAPGHGFSRLEQFLEQLHWFTHAE